MAHSLRGHSPSWQGKGWHLGLCKWWQEIGAECITSQLGKQTTRPEEQSVFSPQVKCLAPLQQKVDQGSQPPTHSTTSSGQSSQMYELVRGHFYIQTISFYPDINCPVAILQITVTQFILEISVALLLPSLAKSRKYLRTRQALSSEVSAK